MSHFILIFVLILGENSVSVAVTTDTKSLMESKAEKAVQSKNDAINNMIIVLAVATIFFNIVYLLIFFNIFNNSEWLKNKDYLRIVINREVETFLYLLKPSITGLLFFVSGEVFRANFYAFFRKCLRFITCK